MRTGTRQTRMPRALAQAAAVALAGLLLVVAAAPARPATELPVLARIGPWPVASHLIGYRGRLWLVNSVRGVNHNSADLYSYDPAAGTTRYERHLFSQDAGSPVVARGLLYWPFEDARFSAGVGHFMVTDGRAWRLGTIPTARTFHTHALATLGDQLIAATSAWRARLQVSADQGRTWREVYDHPTPEGRVTRIVELVSLNDRVFGDLVARQEQGLLQFDGASVSDVPGWPRGRSVLGLTRVHDYVYAAVREPEGVAIWRTDGRTSERRAPPRADWSVRALAAGPDGLWAVTTGDDAGALWQSPDGTAWQKVHELIGGQPFDLALLQGQVYVGGAGTDGRGILWGPMVRRTPPPRPPRAGLPDLRPAPPATARDWPAEGARLDAALADPASYARHSQALRDLIYELALAEPPPDFLARRLAGRLPRDEISLIGGAVTVPAATLARWLLLWGMTLAGEGRVPLALLEQPWRTPANRAEKYFAAPPAAMWVAATVGQDDPATIAALIDRLGRDDDPLWLRGDVVGTLSAVTGQRFGYDLAAWRGWWAEGGERSDASDR